MGQHWLGDRAIDDRHTRLELTEEQFSALELAFLEGGDHQVRTIVPTGVRGSEYLGTDFPRTIGITGQRGSPANLARRYEIPLSNNREAVLFVPPLIAPEDVERMKGWLGLMHGILTNSPS